MIELHAWPTPNGLKISIMLEETGLSYEAHAVDIRAGDQFKAEFLAISPNNKIPAIVDTDGLGGQSISIFESGAILIYLAEKSGKFLSADPRSRIKELEWLMWQVGGVGPMFGQYNHFTGFAEEKLDYPVQRYTKEGDRLMAVLDKRLGEAEFMAGDYSIADIATFPWVRTYTTRREHIEQFPNVKRWFEVISARPGVQRGLTLLAKEREESNSKGLTPEARAILHGDVQFQKR